MASHPFTYAPLSLEQERMWLLTRAFGATPALHERGGAWLDGELDSERLRSAIGIIAKRHEILRTTFAERDGQPVQIIYSDEVAVFREYDVCAEAGEQAQERAFAIAREAVSSPFDLDRGPLYRVVSILVRPGRRLVVLVMHHLISDGDASTGIFFAELHAILHAQLTEKEPRLSACTMQYRDYARWQQEHLNGASLDAQLAYWRDELMGAPSHLELPTFKKRPKLQTFFGAKEVHRCEPALSTGLAALAARAGVDFFAAALASLQVLLHRYSGQEDVVVGTPLAGREPDEFRNLLGYFGNPVIVRTRFEGDPCFEDVLQQVGKSVAHARENGQVGFQKVVSAVAPVRDPSRPPLFQILFALRQGPTAIIEVPGLVLTPVELVLPFVSYDLIVIIDRLDSGLLLQFEYNRDLFEPHMMAALLRHWEVLLRAALLNPRTSVSKLPLLGAEERRQILIEWNNTKTPYPRNACVHEIFEAQVERTPFAVAATADGNEISYVELNRRANKIAHGLRRLAVGPDVPVGIVAERSLDMLVGLIGILKAGGAYMPLDPEYPEERLRTILADSGATVVLSSLGRAAKLRFGGTIVDLSGSAFLEEPEENPPHRATAENLANVIFTSGSTGRPKGVGVLHRGVVRLVKNTNYIDFTPADRVAHVTSLAFDSSTLEIWGALLNGARLVLIAKEMLLSPEAFAARIHKEGLTALVLVTAIFNQMASYIPEAFSQLKHLITGGEAADPRAVQEVLARGAPARLLNLYGPTENTSVTTSHLIKEVPKDALSIPIGRPIANTQVYILDRHLEPVPVGVVGELYTGGDGVARGYLNQPERTQELFIANPFADATAERLYKTGDRVRYLPDGTIEFLGRVDMQVKIRGYRFELGEIEAALGKHPDVRQAAVLLREDFPGDKRLVAYVVAREEGTPPPPAALKQSLAETLPSAMIPAAFVVIPRMPLTPNSKIDYRALPRPQCDSTERTSVIIAPRSELEEKIAEIWKEVLNKESISVLDDFFALGGYSLRALMVTGRIRRRLQVEVPLQRFFAEPTIAGLARFVQEVRNEQKAAAAITPAARGTIVPLSFAQERLWFIHQIAPESRAYHYPAFFRLRGSLHEAALAHGMREIVRRHESLRTTITEHEGQPMQVIAADTSFELEVVNLEALPPQEREARFRQLLASKAQRLFDLRRGPLFRAKLLRLADDEHILLLALHHIITDGFSMNVLYEELSRLYHAFAFGEPQSLPALPIQYSDYALWQRRVAKESGLAAQLAWWKQHLAGAQTTLALPLDRPRPTVQSFRGALVPFRLERSHAEAARALALAEGATPIMVLLTAFFALLSRYTEQEDILIGSPYANRDHTETESIIGFFVNTVVIRGNLCGAPTFRELLARVRDASLKAYDHAELPFEQLVAALEPKRDLSRNPLVQVLFAPQISERGKLSLSKVSVEPLDFDLDKAMCDLTWFVWESPEGIGGRLEFNTDVFDRYTIERLASHLRVLFEGAMERPDTKVIDLPLLTEEERTKILFDFNHTRTEYPRNASIQELFEAQAAQSPLAIAVTCGGGQCTYAELNRRANRLARGLVELGVGPNVPVGILVERSIEMMVGLLGILKAGGAYVPLDPAQPTDRLLGMLEDAAAPLLLATRKLLHKFPFRGQKIDLAQDAFARHSEENLPSRSSAESLAYVMYTSGSTGRPKGVAVPHRAVIRLVVETDYVKILPDDRVLHASNLAFDASTLEVWGALLLGARAVIVPKETLLSPDVLGRCILDEGITLMFLTTAVFHQMASGFPSAFGKVRHLLFGGEVCDPRWVKEVHEKGAPEHLIHVYGPTENTTFSTAYLIKSIPEGGLSVPIGKPIANSQTYILDSQRRPVPIGVTGEIYVGGDGVARGYLNRPELTTERFLPDPFHKEDGARLYRTGDRGRYLPDGTIEFLGRIDHQVKIRGYRIELGEIEVVIRENPAVREAVVVVRQDTPDENRLTAYVVPIEDGALGVPALRDFLKRKLPDYMIPAAFVIMRALPLTPNGKVDVRALPLPKGVNRDSSTAGSGSGPRSQIEEALTAIWREVLEIDEVGLDDAFFDVGGHSLLLAKLRARIRAQLGREVDLVTLFRYATIRSLATQLFQTAEPPPAALPLGSAPMAAPPPKSLVAAESVRAKSEPADSPCANSYIAIIGMAGRFPGADDIESLWTMLRAEKEGIAHFSQEDLAAFSVNSALLRAPDFVPSLGFLRGAGTFDAAFFGYSPKDARLTDPQHRLFLECSWESLENAGYDPGRYGGAIGVYGGCGAPRYWLTRVLGLGARPGTADDYRAVIGNGGDFLATRVAYKLGLRGAAINVQTACSTSLVAIHLACKSLRLRQCDMAIAGGVSVFSLDPTGYVFEEGSILSPDGRCRPFDASANGTVPGSGVAVVVLKRLEDALADGDTIHAVIRGSATNNDGAQKIGFTAPSVDGQAEVIAKAHAAASVKPENIGYVEAHGTATPLGDPIEVAALSQAFHASFSKSSSCVLGSIKGNIGHLDAAAGVTGLIKATLALSRELIPATLHYERPNPALQLETSPFFVSARAIAWPRGEERRRAGVSSFGMGGTNAHIVLEEAPLLPPSGPSRPSSLLVVSARTRSALDAATSRLAAHLDGHAEQALSDIAFTLQKGRAEFAHRRAVVAATHAEATAALQGTAPHPLITGVARVGAPKLVFMFPGVGTQHARMGREFYRHERVYRASLDRCIELFAEKLGLDLRQILLHEDDKEEEVAARLIRPTINMAAIFSTEYALSQLLIAWGIVPSALIGHSLGEYAAACISGMLHVEDAVTLIALRGQLVEQFSDTAMLIVPLSEDAIAPHLGEQLSLAAVNGPSLCVVSGMRPAIDALRAELLRTGITARLLPIAMASHSPLVDPFVDRIAEQAAQLLLRPPQIPTISNVTGTWISEADACDPAYWARHLRRTVRFADGLGTMLTDPDSIFVEVGPGKHLASLARLHPSAHPERLIVSTMAYQGSRRTDFEALLHALGTLFCAGVAVNWNAFSDGESRKRVPLPTYPFERTLHVLAEKPHADSHPHGVPSEISRADEEQVGGGAQAAFTQAEALVATKMAALPSPSSTSRSSESGVEKILADIWMELLEVKQVRRQDNFFDLGGSSLIAVQLRSLVKERLGITLPIHVFIENPTLGELLAPIAKAIAMEPKSADKNDGAFQQNDRAAVEELKSATRLMVRLQAGSAEQIPLFLIQPVGGTVYTYVELVKQLPPTRPVYAFRSSGMEPGEPIYAEISQMATRYLEEVLAVRPQGPFLLGGHSGGGTVAYEMACQLLARGHSKIFVWMADSGYTTQYERMNVKSIEDVIKAMDAFREIAKESYRAFIAALQEDSMVAEVVLANYRALASYQPQQSRAEVVYVRAKERDTVLDKHPELGWMELVDGPFTLHKVSGNHFTMMQTGHIESIARIINRHIDSFLAERKLRPRS